MGATKTGKEKKPKTKIILKKATQKQIDSWSIPIYRDAVICK